MSRRPVKRTPAAGARSAAFRGNGSARINRLSGQRFVPFQSQIREAVDALPKVLKIVGSVVAPTALLTALLFYFGRLHAQGLFRYLRVHFTIFDLSVQDYLVRSADGLFLPVTIAAALGLVALWVHRLLLDALSPSARSRILRVLAPLAAACGIALLVLAAVATSNNDAVLPGFPEAGGLSLSIGVLLLAYALRLARRSVAQRRPARLASSSSGPVVLAEWSAVFVLVSVGLFWAINSYAIGVGTSRGQQIERELASSPDVVLYSEKSLSLQTLGAREMACQNPDAAYRFRYEGLKFVLQSGDQYLFLPATWTRASGAALVVPRSDALRLEFTGPGQAGHSTTC